MSLLYKELSDRIIGHAFKIHSKLGCSLPEYCYERALCLEFREFSIPFARQVYYSIYHRCEYVGHFIADIVVDSCIILELKSDESITPRHESQLFTYLRVSDIKVGYVLNFGTKSLQFKRLIL